MLNAQLNRDPITRSASIAAALVLTAVTVVVAGFGASAQSQFGSVAGSVTDQNGRSIAGVTLVLSNAAAQTKYEVKSDGSGHYEFVSVPAGNYELTFEFPGMSAIRREGLGIAGGRGVEVNAVMKIGSVSETITVTNTPDGPRSLPPVRDLSGARALEKPDPCAASTAGACVRPPIKIKDVRPIYPAGADAGPSGTVVILSGHIDTSGLVSDLQVLRSIDPAFSSAAIQAVSAWEFLPTHLDGQPIETRMTVVVNFNGAK